MTQEKPIAKLVPLHTEIVLDSCDVDEIRQFTSLRIRIRDRNDVGINIEFQSHQAYRVYDEGQTLSDPLYVPETGYTGHWLYESDDCKYLRSFHEQSLDTRRHQNVKNYIVITSNDIVEVLATEPPQISMRTDTMRSWTRPGESVSE